MNDNESKNVMNPNIQWKPVYINGIKTQYMVSEYGNVFNTKSEKLLKPVPLQISGRLRVLIYINGTRYDRKIHRLVYEAFHGPIPKDMTVDHIDENILNNHYSNLRLLTASENIKSFRRNHRDHVALYSDDLIREYYKLLKKGIYYRRAAKKLNIQTGYALDLMNGRRRQYLWELYKPFPDSAHRKIYLTKSDIKVATKAIIDGCSTREILNMLDVKYGIKGIYAIQRLRKKLGIKDPRYFDSGFLNDVDHLIMEGKTNQEIYRILCIEFNTRISDMMARRRKKLNIPNNNCKVGNPEEINLIKYLIQKGYSNDEILKKIGKERNKYYVNLFGKLRYKMNKK